MAKVTGVFTGFRGKVGNVVYSMKSGTQVYKTRSIPANPRTVNQVNQRNLFSDFVKNFKILSYEWIPKFWDPFQEKSKSGWQAFVSKNLKAMSGTFDISKFIASYGSLEPIYDFAATYNSATGNITFSWSKSVFMNGSIEDDLSFLVLHNVSGEVLGYSLWLSSRDELSIGLDIISDLTASEIDVFCVANSHPVPLSSPYIVSNSVRTTCTAAV